MAARRGDGPEHRRGPGGHGRDHEVDLAARLGLDSAAGGHARRSALPGSRANDDVERLRRAVRSHRRRSRLSSAMAALLLVLALAVLVLVLVTGGVLPGS